MNIIKSSALPPDTIVVSEDLYLALTDPARYAAKQTDEMNRVMIAADALSGFLNGATVEEPFDPSNL